MSITERITLDRVLVVEDEIIDAVTPMTKRFPPLRLDDRDALAIRRIVKGWGRTCRVELTCPATWWQHLKLALRTRWPRLFGRLVVAMRKAVAENGVIVAGLAPVLARHLVIPYRVPTSFTSFADAVAARSREDRKYAIDDEDGDL